MLLNLNTYEPEGLENIRRGGIYEERHPRKPEDDGRFCYVIGRDKETGMWNMGMAYVEFNLKSQGFDAFEEGLDENTALDLLKQWDMAQYLKIENGLKIKVGLTEVEGVTASKVIIPPSDVNESYTNDI